MISFSFEQVPTSVPVFMPEFILILGSELKGTVLDRVETVDRAIAKCLPSDVMHQPCKILPGSMYMYFYLDNRHMTLDGSAL